MLGRFFTEVSSGVEAPADTSQEAMDKTTLYAVTRKRDKAQHDAGNLNKKNMRYLDVRITVACSIDYLLQRYKDYLQCIYQQIYIYIHTKLRTSFFRHG